MTVIVKKIEKAFCYFQIIRQYLNIYGNDSNTHINFIICSYSVIKKNVVIIKRIYK
jgi:hypothetical protein